MRLCSLFEFGIALSCDTEPKTSRKPLLRDSPVAKVVASDDFLQMAVAQRRSQVYHSLTLDYYSLRSRYPPPGVVTQNQQVPFHPSTLP
jgi:hypothetical protein